MEKESVFASADVLEERRQYLHSLGVTDKQIRRNCLLVDVPEDAWKVMLNELLRERRRKGTRKAK
jgi:hypothetical protein